MRNRQRQKETGRERWTQAEAKKETDAESEKCNAVPLRQALREEKTEEMGPLKEDRISDWKESGNYPVKSESHSIQRVFSNL